MAGVKTSRHFNKPEKKICIHVYSVAPLTWGRCDRGDVVPRHNRELFNNPPPLSGALRLPKVLTVLHTGDFFPRFCTQRISFLWHRMTASLVKSTSVPHPHHELPHSQRRAAHWDDRRFGFFAECSSHKSCCCASDVRSPPDWPRHSV